MRARVFDRTYFGVESTEGTPVGTTKILQGLNWVPRPDIPMEPVEVQGYSVPIDLQRFKESCGGELQAALAVNELAYLLASLLEEPAITTPSTDGIYALNLDSPDSGTFTLTFGGQTTTAIAYNANAAAIQAALVALSTIGTGNVRVDAIAGTTDSFQVTFQAALERTTSALTGTFASLVGAAGAGLGTTAASAARRWTYTPSGSAANTGKTYTFAGGSADGAVRVAGCKVAELTLSLQPRQACEVTARHLGRVYEAGYQVQTLYLSGSPAGGTYTLTYSGQTTAAIAYDATAATVQAALESLSNVGIGDVQCVAGTGCIHIAFLINGPNALTPALLTADGTGLTGGSTPAANIGNAVQGYTATELAHALINPPSIDVYVGSTLLGLAKLNTEHCLQATLNIPERHAGVFDLNSGNPSYSGTVERRNAPAAQLLVEENSTTNAYLATLRARSKRYCRIVGTGGSIESGYVYRFEITFAFKYANPGPGESDGLGVTQWDLQLVHDTTLGSWIEAKLDTALTAL